MISLLTIGQRADVPVVRIREKRRRKRRLLPRLIAATVVAWGLFIAFYFYHDSASEAQRAMADCIQEHNPTAVGSSGEEARAVAALCASTASLKH